MDRKTLTIKPLLTIKASIGRTQPRTCPRERMEVARPRPNYGSIVVGELQGVLVLMNEPARTAVLTYLPGKVKQGLARGKLGVKAPVN
ncbi:hypothetical protein B484DRAFT_442506 [Ochromonadaceae sp. CCMP2298]|nr:hypothetical protein B484DRAFT_442506 [Ochromonadaceae sp. CCMP2298]